jgi:hypothetical protein
MIIINAIASLFNIIFIIPFFKNKTFPSMERLKN